MEYSAYSYFILTMQMYKWDTKVDYGEREKKVWKDPKNKKIN